jgi:hypothetical protein
MGCDTSFLHVWPQALLLRRHRIYRLDPGNPRPVDIEGIQYGANSPFRGSSLSTRRESSMGMPVQTL